MLYGESRIRFQSLFTKFALEIEPSLKLTFCRNGLLSRRSSTMKSAKHLFSLTLCLFAFLFSVQAEDEGPKYQTGFSATMKLGTDLYNSLKEKYRSQIAAQPISLETDVKPFIKPVEYPDEKQPIRMVFISVGFLDLINHVAHAKAIDKIEPGYFQKYLLTLAEEQGEMSLKEPPKISDKRFWSDDIMNEQLSNFNQMAGMLVAMNLSHFYLGHYKKYGDKLSDEDGKKPEIIDNLLTSAEWEDSLKCGAAHALDCGFGVDGIKALYDCFSKMPKRPAWTKYFLPEKANVSKVKGQLEKWEKDYFHGQLTY